MAAPELLPPCLRIYYPASVSSNTTATTTTTEGNICLPHTPPSSTNSSSQQFHVLPSSPKPALQSSTFCTTHTPQLPSSLLHAHSDWALHVSTTSTGSRVASSGLDGVIRLYNNPTLTHIHLPSKTPGLQVSLSDVDVLAIACGDGNVRLYTTTSGELLQTFSARAYSGAAGCALSPHASLLCTAHTTLSDARISVHGLQLQNSASHSVCVKGRATGVAISADGSRVSYASNGYATISDTNLTAVSTKSVVGEPGLSLSVNGNFWAIADATCLRLLDLRENTSCVSGRQTMVLGEYLAPGGYGRVALSENCVIAAVKNGHAVWDLRMTARRKAWIKTKGRPNGCALSKDGNWIVMAANDGRVRAAFCMMSVENVLRKREIGTWRPRW